MTEDQALIPIEDSLPELRDERYCEVVRLDREDRADEAAFSAASGERLARIRDILMSPANAGSGLWSRYLAARGLSPSAASDRIAAWQGQKRAHGAPGRSAPLISSPEAHQLGADLAATRAALERRDAEFATINHELAAAHVLIKRLKDKRTPEEIAAAEQAAEDRDIESRIRRAKERVEAFRAAADEERAKTPPKERAAQAAARKQFWRKEQVILVVETQFDSLLKRIPTPTDASEYSAEQLQRLVALLPKVADLAARLELLAALVHAPTGDGQDA